MPSRLCFNLMRRPWTEMDCLVFSSFSTRRDVFLGLKAHVVNAECDNETFRFLWLLHQVISSCVSHWIHCAKKRAAGLTENAVAAVRVYLCCSFSPPHFLLFLIQIRLSQCLELKHKVSFFSPLIEYFSSDPSPRFLPFTQRLVRRQIGVRLVRRVVESKEHHTSLKRHPNQPMCC